ncbi:hypothetical protein NST81_09410 [Bacillus sp. FSL W8-0223]|uniref:hypothetical protein n=1 Tax=Bacillus sp. FSL W8-0223 TaxID=2954595 RepID=UPI0030F58D9D
MLMGNIKQFKHLSQFATLKDFNNHIEMWLAEYKSQFTKSELIALKRLIRFSAKVYGVSTASINTILNATEKDGIGVSESTFHRMKRKAVKIGILSIHYTTRKNGSQSSNVWVFNRFTNDTPINDVKESETKQNQGVDDNVSEAQMTTHKTSNLSKTSIHNNKRYDGTEAEFTSNRVPKRFKELVSCFFPKSQQIEEFFRVTQQVTKHTSYYSEEEKLQLSIDAFKQVIRNIKLGKRKIKNVFGYYNRVLNNILDHKYFDELYELDQKLGLV